ncbi:hypothetical protein SAMN04487945_1473 [Halobacterium jilantaiense]|uniref:Uncharacterized protein n=1 Tax=Halobacterium jilantaiense TaxID=355548 RepID=A0A1I0P7S7_9EURY|nr:hypothetical protein SAMN04487945_1473 [Halobacterium jilantaiense]
MKTRRSIQSNFVREYYDDMDSSNSDGDLDADDIDDPNGNGEKAQS